MQKNGWNLFQFKPFAQRLQSLTQDVARTDVYEVFKRMLERGEVPSTIDELIQESIDPQP